MADSLGSRWNTDPDRDVDHGRRRILLGAAALTIAAPLVAFPASAIAADPRGFVLALGGRHWDRAVELTALRHIYPDRTLALQLLGAAIERDLHSPHRKPALRLYDLYAALGSPVDRLALAGLVRSSTMDTALLARATLWADVSRLSRQRVWRTVNADGTPLGIFIAPG